MLKSVVLEFSAGTTLIFIRVYIRFVIRQNQIDAVLGCIGVSAAASGFFKTGLSLAVSANTLFFDTDIFIPLAVFANSGLVEGVPALGLGVSGGVTAAAAASKEDFFSA